MSAGFAQKSQKTTFEFPDRTVTILVPDLVKVEKTESSGFRLTYKVESFVDAQPYENRIFVEFTTTFLKPQKATTVVLDMTPFENPAVLHAWNPDDRAAYVTFDENNATIDLGSINYMSAEEKFSGDVKAIGFSTKLSTEVGDHVVEIREFSAK